MERLLKIFLLQLFCFTSSFVIGQDFSPEEKSQIDSLNKIISNKFTHDTSKVNAYISLSEILYVANTDTIIPISEKVLEICKKALSNKKTNQEERTAFIKAMAYASSNIGFVYYEKGDIKIALSYFEKALNYGKQIDDKLGIGSSLNSIGWSYKLLGDIPKALAYLHQALKIKEEIKDDKGIAYALNNLGLVYSEQKDFTNAVKYHKKSFEIRKTIDDQFGMGQSLHNLGYTFSLDNNTDSSLFYFFKSLKIKEELNNKSAIASTYNSIGFAYKYLEKIDSAEYYFRKAIELRVSSGDKMGQVTTLINLGQLFLDKNNLNQAEAYAKEGYKIAYETGVPYNIQVAANLLYKIYKKKRNFEKSLQMFELDIQMKDSIENETNQEAAIRQQTQYEFDKQKVLDDAEHEKQLAIEKEAKAKQKVITYATAVGLGLVAVFLVFVFNRLQVTRRQKNVIEEQKSIVEKAHHELEEKNKEIMDSITYAKRIQSAILPPQKLVKEYLPESFILYKPKDIVAGDFYWMEHKNGKILFAAADCTGHGVPGAMVSVVCNNGLNRSVREHGITEPGKILDKTREIVIQEFEKSDEEVKDGMDISLCGLDLNNNTLTWSGANNPLWIIRNNEIIEYKADKQPIGKYAESKPFTTHQIELEKGDSIYIFTDGYQDQFGGEKGKKFKAAKLRELLLSIQHEPMEKQRETIDQSFETWKGNLEQVDDVCIIGVKI